MDSMASFSPRAARDPVASASSSAAARLGGGGSARGRFRRRFGVRGVGSVRVRRRVRVRRAGSPRVSVRVLHHALHDSLRERPDVEHVRDLTLEARGARLGLHGVRHDQLRRALDEFSKLVHAQLAALVVVELVEQRRDLVHGAVRLAQVPVGEPERERESVVAAHRLHELGDAHAAARVGVQSIENGDDHVVPGLLASRGGDSGGRGGFRGGFRLGDFSLFLGLRRGGLLLQALPLEVRLRQPRELLGGLARIVFLADRMREELARRLLELLLLHASLLQFAHALLHLRRKVLHGVHRVHEPLLLRRMPFALPLGDGALLLVLEHAHGDRNSRGGGSPRRGDAHDRRGRVPPSPRACGGSAGALFP